MTRSGSAPRLGAAEPAFETHLQHVSSVCVVLQVSVKWPPTTRCILRTLKGNSLAPYSVEYTKAEVSCALLLDMTGSMYSALPALKSAAMRFIRDLRAVDSVAVYSFSDSVSLLQPFTSDKGAAKRAVMGTRAAGQTALYDALTRVSRDLAARPGKKVIVVFTDGEDNLSTLASGLAVRRIKAIGTPVYTIAQGQALSSHALLKHLSELSTVTGGLPFQGRAHGGYRRGLRTNLERSPTDTYCRSSRRRQGAKAGSGIASKWWSDATSGTRYAPAKGASTGKRAYMSDRLSSAGLVILTSGIQRNGSPSSVGPAATRARMIDIAYSMASRLVTPPNSICKLSAPHN